MAAIERQSKSLGICSTCNYAKSCVYLARATSPIWHCDEFDDYIPPVNALSAHKSTATNHSVANAPNPPLGLCCNCDNFATCMLPKPEGGVWHCEEYK